MTDIQNDALIDEVLLEFSVEPGHSKATLDKYIKNYPQFEAELVDLAEEIFEKPISPDFFVENENSFQIAWLEICDAESKASLDLFGAFKGKAFVELARSLNVNRTFLVPFRDRLVKHFSVPNYFLERLAAALTTTPNKLIKYLSESPLVSKATNFKSDEKPQTQQKEPFEYYLEHSELSEEQKKLLRGEVSRDGCK